MTHETLSIVLALVYVFLVLPFWLWRGRLMVVALAAAVAGTLLVVTSPLPVGPVVWGAMIVLALARRLLAAVVDRGTYGYIPHDVANPTEMMIVPHRAISLTADIVTIVLFGIVATLSVAGAVAR